MLVAEVSPFQLHVLWRETDSRLDAYSRMVAESKELESALSFCRWLQGSGIIRLLKEHAQELHWPQSHHFRVDGALIQSKVDDLTREIQDRYRTGNTRPKIDVAELERINHKLDLIAGQISRVLPVPEADISAPPLRLYEGGANG